MQKYKSYVNILSDISDHFSQFCIIQSVIESKQYPIRKVRDFSCFSEKKFKNDLALIDWNPVIIKKGDNADKLFNAFYDKVTKLVSKHAPMKPVSKPWITKGIRGSIIIKNRLFSSGDKQNYKIYRNKITKLRRISKKIYYNEYFNKNLSNIKKTCEGISNLLNRKKKNHKSITKMKCPVKNDFIYNPKDIPDVFNKYFSNIGQSLASKLPESRIHFSYYLKDNYSNSFYFNHVTPYEIESEITQLSCSKSVGLYSCPTRMLNYEILSF